MLSPVGVIRNKEELLHNSNSRSLLLRFRIITCKFQHLVHPLCSNARLPLRLEEEVVGVAVAVLVRQLEQVVPADRRLEVLAVLLVPRPIDQPPNHRRPRVVSL